MRIADLIHILTQRQWAIRAWRLNAHQRPMLIDITRQHAELPGETGSRVQAEQRWAFGNAQRQHAVKTALVGLFLRAFFRQ
ncbi:hypothetical protein D3C80_1925290 [compost metagenome]